MEGLGNRFIFGLVLLTFSEASVRYDGCEVWKVEIRTPEQYQLLLDLYMDHDHTEERKVMFWEAPSSLDTLTQLLVCPSGKDTFQKFLRKSGIKAVVRNADIQKDIDEQLREYETRKKISKLEYDENNFNTYEDIMNQLEVLRNNCPADFSCSVETIGLTYEERELKLFTLEREGQNRRGVWIDSLIHSREWITAPTTMGILTKLIRDYGHDSDVSYLLDNYDFYLVPVMNPDGYSYTWTEDRFWRKNRSPTVNSTCLGKDLNRNYDYLWHGPEGASNNPCDDTFRGERPTSELETYAIQQEGQRLADHLILWMSFHCYGHVYLCPFGHLVNGTCGRADDYADLKQVGDTAVNAISATFTEVEWTSGDGCDRSFVTSGITQDWAKGAGIVKYSYSPELRGEGFEISPSLIPASVIENWNGLVAMMGEIENIESY